MSSILIYDRVANCPRLSISYSHHLALLIDEPTEMEKAVKRSGFLFFTDMDSFREYVNREVLALSSA
jgi:hypothetical protein